MKVFIFSAFCAMGLALAASAGAQELKVGDAAPNFKLPATDGKTYEVYLEPSSVSVDDKLRVGVDVTAETHFDGSRYIARSLTVNER
jgi:hypothetical protein